jgi:hypothetical protein
MSREILARRRAEDGAIDVSDAPDGDKLRILTLKVAKNEQMVYPTPMFNAYSSISAWNEILARTFGDLRSQHNVSPEWLVNPTTRRRLKLDRYYPEVGIAIRFLGLTAKGQGRQSDQEIYDTEQRDQTRQELCRQQGVELMLIDPAEDTVKQIDALLRTLARASRLLAQSSRPDGDKARLMPMLNDARSRANELRAHISKEPEQMLGNLSESWRDREAGLANAPEPQTAKALARSVQPPRLAEGQRVHHERFGEGVVIALNGEGEACRVTILFDGSQERSFLLSLVGDKLQAHGA